MRRGNFINGFWKLGSDLLFQSINPATDAVVWEGNAASEEDVDHAVEAAIAASSDWIDLGWRQRSLILESFRENLLQGKAELAEMICQETGKILWDALTEVDAMMGKLSISVEAYSERSGERFKDLAGIQAATRHKALGVVAVFGPYNFPGHLPNGHIVPALIAGNTVVFKPSELAPRVGEWLVDCWQRSGLPSGVLNLVQGERKTGMSLSKHPKINGLFFTGSSDTGKLLHRQFSEHPEKLLALEMGGNNPLIVGEVGSAMEAAVYQIIQSSFLSAGQRCTCARRLILIKNQTNVLLIEKLVEAIKTIKVGAYTQKPEPFMGPVVSKKVAQQLLDFQQGLRDKGGVSLVEMKRLHPSLPFLSPGLMDVTGVLDRPDREAFGPFLQLIQVDSLEEAIAEANQTAYGLSAGVLSTNRDDYERCYRKSKAGIVNWNRPLTGASSAAPFGGTGLSGNHRPSAYYAADYCSYPVASLEMDELTLPEKLSPGVMV